MLKSLKRRSTAVVLMASLVLASGAALAQDKLRIGKSVPNSWAFAATDVGVQAGIFKQEGIDLAISSFKGDAQMQTGLTAGAVDVALGSGPGLGSGYSGTRAPAEWASGTSAPLRRCDATDPSTGSPKLMWPAIRSVIPIAAPL